MRSSILALFSLAVFAAAPQHAAGTRSHAARAAISACVAKYASLKHIDVTYAIRNSSGETATLRIEKQPGNNYTFVGATRGISATYSCIGGIFYRREPGSNTAKACVGMPAGLAPVAGILGVAVLDDLDAPRSLVSAVVTPAPSMPQGVLGGLLHGSDYTIRNAYINQRRVTVVGVTVRSKALHAHAVAVLMRFTLTIDTANHVLNSLETGPVHGARPWQTWSTLVTANSARVGSIADDTESSASSRVSGYANAQRRPLR